MALSRLDLSDPTKFLAILVAVSLVAAISTALRTPGGWRGGLSIWLRDGSFGIAVPLVIYHRIENIGGDAILLLGLAVLCASGGEQVKQFLFGLVKRFAERKSDK